VVAKSRKKSGPVIISFLVSSARKQDFMAGLNSVGFSSGENEIDREGLRTRLRKMSDQELLRYGRAAKSMCSPDAYFGQAPRQTFVIQLEEAKAEWRRRNPNLPLADSI
jgi:hypothetical protein